MSNMGDNLGELLVHVGRLAGHRLLRGSIDVTSAFVSYLRKAGPGTWGLLAFCAWKGEKYLPLLRRLIALLTKAELLTLVGMGIRRLIAWIRGPKVVVDNFSKLNTREVVLESVRAGSTEQAMSVPKAQVMVGQMVSGNFHAHGCGVRMEKFLVLPDHVYSYANRDTKRTFVMGKTKNIIEITGRETQVIDTDLVYVELSADEWGRLGVAVMSIYVSMSDRGALAQIVGASAMGTTGVLKHDESVFGRVVYEGTTVGGYSGAAYLVGNQLAGIHQCGGKVNGGYSAQYLWVTIMWQQKMRLEDTEDWLKQKFQARKRLIVDKSWGALDEVRIKYDGTYAVVERSSMAKAFGSDWNQKLNDSGVLYLEPRGAYTDNVYESGEARSSSILGDSSVLSKSQGNVELTKSDLIKEFSTYTPEQLKKLSRAMQAAYGKLVASNTHPQGKSRGGQKKEAS